jgi:hypothetical protein
MADPPSLNPSPPIIDESSGLKRKTILAYRQRNTSITSATSTCDPIVLSSTIREVSFFLELLQNTNEESFESAKEISDTIKALQTQLNTLQTQLTTLQTTPQYLHNQLQNENGEGTQNQNLHESESENDNEKTILPLHTKVLPQTRQIQNNSNTNFSPSSSPTSPPVSPFASPSSHFASPPSHLMSPPSHLMSPPSHSSRQLPHSINLPPHSINLPSHFNSPPPHTNSHSVSHRPAPLSSSSFASYSATYSPTRKLKRSASLSVNPPPPPSTQPKLSKRGCIIKELLTTEESYVKGLEILVNRFQIPLYKLSQNSENSLRSQDVSQMFSNVDVLLTLHQQLLTSIKHAIATSPSEITPNDALIGRLFIEFGPKCIPYAQYGQEYQNCIVIIRKMHKKSSLSSFFAANLDKHHLSIISYLESLLITPIQRIPRYGLLLTSLSEQTPPDHPDHNHVLEAIMMMKKVGHLVNDVCQVGFASQQMENVLNIRNAEKTLTGIALAAKITLHGARGLRRLGDYYCVASIGKNAYSTSVAVESADPVWGDIWQVGPVDVTRTLNLIVYRKNRVGKTFSGKAKVKLFKPLNVYLTSSHLKISTVLSTKKQAVGLRPLEGGDINVTGNVMISVELSLKAIVEPKAIDSRTFSLVWRKYCDVMSSDVALTDSQTLKFFYEIFELSNTECDEPLVVFFLSLLANSPLAENIV